MIIKSMANRLKIHAIFFGIVSLAMCTHANAFLVSDFSGSKVEVDDFIGDGRWTVVMLWQLDCIPCEEQKPAIEAFHKQHASTNAHVIGLVVDGHEYMPEIKSFYDANPTLFPSLVVFGDVFHEQIIEETGKQFPVAPGYIVYSPDGEIKLAINRLIDVDQLIGHIESQFSN